MSVNRLLIRDLRNLRAVEIHPASGVNLFYGANGSGKTSLLEAIHLLSVGRSFRSHKIKSLINESKPALTVFARVQSGGSEFPIGIQRQRNGLVQFKVSGRLLHSVAELVSYLPLQVIDAEAFSLLGGGPSVRRQFLDWLVFHVEPGFYPAWRNAQRCLKHRNTLLRRGRISHAEMAPWDEELILASNLIQELRSRCFEAFAHEFINLVHQFVAADGLTIKLFRGWDKSQAYASILKEGLERDMQAGYTHAGINRADIRIRINGTNAAEVLSRGQQKLLVCALKIAQGVIFEKLTGRKCLYLVDDLPAELDDQYRVLLVNWLEKLDTQVFITGVEKAALLQPWQSKQEKNLKVFHVEHGQITEDNSEPDSQPVRPTE